MKGTLASSVADNELEWYRLAVCQNMETNLFFDYYESDSVLAGNVDEICESCPVRKFCLEEGVLNGETGVWGGVYLVGGRAVPSKNAHKTKAQWDDIRKMLTDVLD